jgi:L-ascorbate metabolism protein UlaG (beta-lactamase superfamily)
MTTSERPTETPIDPAGASLQFVGNATVLLRVAGLTILTDPNFVPKGTEIGLGYGLKTTRLTDPSMLFEDLPALDAVLLSHLHADHFDQLVEERLDRSVPIITTPQAATALGEKGFARMLPLDTWERHELTGPSGHVRITSLPARHAPGPLEIALPDVMGSLLEFRRDGAGERPDLRLYITGDTIFYEGLREIPERHPEIDLALLHLGGTRVMGVTVTMDADQGLELLQTLKPPLAVPIHYDDYEAFKSPLEDFVDAVRKAGLEDRVRYVARGEAFDLREASERVIA